MKKFVLLPMLLTLLTLGAYAQSGFFHIGIKGGANLNKISGQGYDESFRFNYHLGGFAQINLTKGFGIQPEVIFSQSTSKTSTQFTDIYNDIDNQYNDREIKLNYLNIPILANIDLGGERLKLQVGPQYSILLDDHKSLVHNGQEAFKNGDFSAVAGLWLQLPLRINVSARYVIGLSDISDLPDNRKWQNQAIQLGVGFTF